MNQRISGVEPIKWHPRFPLGPISSRLTRLLPIRGGRPIAGTSVENVPVNSHVRLRLIRPSETPRPHPVLLWMHGGGHVGGSPQQDDPDLMKLARDLGIAVAAVRYRIGIEAPAPTSVLDCFDALLALTDHPGEFGIDPNRIAIGGAGSGGGVAAALALYSRDHGGPPLRMQVLVYPMLDDRTTLRDDLDDIRVWTAKNNRFGWQSYLRRRPGGDDVSPVEAPARATSLAGLPTAWIGVGTDDLFFDEDTIYAQRLQQAGVNTEFVLVEGGCHGFDSLTAGSAAAQRFWDAQAQALRNALLA